MSEDNLFWRAIHSALNNPLVFRVQGRICNDYSAVKNQFAGELAGGNLRILDVGCSTGASISRMFDLKKVDYTGIELVPEYAAIARRMNPDGRFLAMDARRIELPDASYDRVLFLAVWHHMDDDTVRAALSETGRVLAPGGKVLVAENIFTPGRFFSTLLLKHDRGKHIRTPDSYRDLARGWKIEREGTFELSLHRMFAMVLVPVEGGPDGTKGQEGREGGD